MIGAIASVAGSLLGNIYGYFAGRKQYKENMKDYNAVGDYQDNPQAAQQLAMANNIYNGRMAGAVGAEQNIMSQQASTQEAVNRNATDASQAMAVAAGLQENSNSEFARLAQTEAMDKMRRAGMVMQAQNTVIGEGRFKRGDQLERMQTKMGIRSVKTQNDFNAVQGLGGSMSMFGNMWDNGAFKKGGKAPNSYDYFVR